MFAWNVSKMAEYENEIISVKCPRRSATSTTATTTISAIWRGSSQKPKCEADTLIGRQKCATGLADDMFALAAKGN